MIYILGYDQYYPAGGIGDYCDKAATLEEAKERVKSYPHRFEFYDFLTVQDNKIMYWYEGEGKSEWIEISE
jgi:hypothetical protein